MSNPEIELGKYMVARLLETRPKTAVYGIFSKDSEERLGTVKWFSPWRQYCFFCADVTVFSLGCLQGLEKFLADLKEARKEGKS